MPLKSLGLRLPAIETLRPGACFCTKRTTFATSSGARSSIAISVFEYQPFSFKCAAKRSRNAPQRRSSAASSISFPRVQGQSE